MLPGWPGAQGHNILSTVILLGRLPSQEPSAHGKPGSWSSGASKKEQPQKSVERTNKDLKKMPRCELWPSRVLTRCETLTSWPSVCAVKTTLRAYSNFIHHLGKKSYLSIYFLHSLVRDDQNEKLKRLFKACMNFNILPQEFFF